MQKNINVDNYDQMKEESPQKEFAIFAMFLNQKTAQQAIKSLKSQGFATEDISILAPEKSGTHDFVYEQRTGIKMGTIVGAIVGFFIFGLIGIIIGATNPFELGLSSWVVASVVGALSGLILGAAAGALVGIGTPMPAAKRYGFYLKEGGIVVMMHLRNNEDKTEAHRILEKSDGQDIAVLEESQIWSTILPEKKKLTFH